MVCETMKAGTDCAFMTKTGCGYSGGSCRPIVEQCEGCQRTVEFSSGKVLQQLSKSCHQMESQCLQFCHS